MKDFSFEIEIYNNLVYFLSQNEFPTALLSYKENESGYLSVELFGKKVILHIKIGKKASYFEVNGYNKKTLINAPLQNSGWLRINLENENHDEQLYYPVLLRIFNDELWMLHTSEVGCCHRYVECSDAMKCVIPDSNDKIKMEIKYQCGYHRNLKKGRIFYGKNKNIQESFCVLLIH